MPIPPLVWIFTFIVVCTAVTNLFKTVDRTFNRPIPSAVVELDEFSPNATGPYRYAKPPASSAADQRRDAAKLLLKAQTSQQATLRTIDQWHDEITPLLQEEDAAAIAVDSDFVEKLSFVMRQRRPMPSEVSALGDQIDSWQDRLKKLEDSSSKLLSPREMYELSQLRSDAMHAQLAWERSLKQARAIVNEAGEGVAPNLDPTLGETLRQLDSRETIQEIEDAIIQRETFGEEWDPLADGLFSFPPELRQEAFSADVTSALSPFLEPRTIQPSLAGQFSIKFARTSEKQPMSFGKLISIGAMHDSELGRKKLALIGGNRKLPEPKWDIASQPNSWSEDDEEFLRESQRMLRDYGAILVQAGFLSP